ncbi:MAG: hypothetical protein HC909_04250 [Blastochloris sp.]|nr:hypothetical protein [Blastochloris sp.]
MLAQTVLEELTQDELTREHVQQRVDDWVQRINKLYEDVESWLPFGWTARRAGLIIMQEDLMKKASVESCKLPTLELVEDGSANVQLRPYGLWIIGANGRIDLIKGRDLYFILDHSKIFEPPSWHIADATARKDSKPFDAERLRAILAA